MLTTMNLYKNKTNTGKVLLTAMIVLAALYFAFSLYTAKCFMSAKPEKTVFFSTEKQMLVDGKGKEEASLNLEYAKTLKNGEKFLKISTGEYVSEKSEPYRLDKEIFFIGWVIVTVPFLVFLYVTQRVMLEEKAKFLNRKEQR